MPIPCPSVFIFLFIIVSKEVLSIVFYTGIVLKFNIVVSDQPKSLGSSSDKNFAFFLKKLQKVYETHDLNSHCVTYGRNCSDRVRGQNPLKDPRGTKELC